MTNEPTLCPFQEATVALKVDEMWKKVYERRQDLMEEWIQCFRDGPVDAVDESKWEIRKSLTEYGTNPRKNFLLRLMSCDPSLRGFRYFRQMCEICTVLSVIRNLVIFTRDY